MKQNFENGYTFDIPTMQFKKTDRMTPRNAQVDQVNLLIKNTRSTFGVLGMDKTYVNGFDEDILAWVESYLTNRYQEAEKIGQATAQEEPGREMGDDEMAGEIPR